MIAHTTEKLKTNQFLTGIVIRWTNNEFVGGNIFPTKTVQKESDKYRIFKKDGFYKGAPIKVDGAITEEVSLAYDEGVYSCAERAIKDIVTDRAMQNADSPVNPKIDTAKFLTEKIMLSEEIDQLLLAIGTNGLNQAGYRQVCTTTTAWVDGTAPDILGDLSTAIVTMSKAIGKRPNSIMFNTQVAEAVANNDKILEILKYHTTNMISGDILPATLRNMRVIIADALVNTADEGQDANYEYIIGDNAVLTYVKPGDPMNFGYTFVSRGFKVVDWYDKDREGIFIKNSKIYAPIITNLEAGWLISNLVSG
jgi:hypothetical protein